MRRIFKYVNSILNLMILKIRYFHKIKFDFNMSPKYMIYLGTRSEINLKHNSKLIIGKKVLIEKYVRIEGVNGDIRIGNRCFFNRNCNIVSLKKIQIGDNCLFGPNVGIYDHNHCFNKRNIPISKQGYEKAEINIGNNIWIGANVVITAGVDICNFVVIAANSVVTKNITESGVYAGIPAKLIKRL